MIAFKSHYLGVFAMLACLLNTLTFGAVIKTCQPAVVIAEDVGNRCDPVRLGGGTACRNEDGQCLNRLAGDPPVLEQGKCCSDADPVTGVRKCRCVSASLVVQTEAIDSLVDLVSAAALFPSSVASVGESAACLQLAVLLTAIEQTAQDLEDAVCLDVFFSKAVLQLDRLFKKVPQLDPHAEQCGIPFNSSGVTGCLLFKKGQMIAGQTL